jgi:hypothetical protein
MYEREVVCDNCGTSLSFPDDTTVVVTCPICQLPYQSGAVQGAPLLTMDTFELQLGALLTQARRDGLPPDEIMRVLREELAFTAELAHSGHHFLVQLVDLGPQELDDLLPTRTRGRLLRTRTVGR